MNIPVCKWSAAAFLATLLSSTHAATPIPLEAFAKLPEIQSVSMSSDGKHLVALVASPVGSGEDTALATWDLDHLEAGSTITPSGDRMKFVAASAMKAGRVLAISRQEWTGEIGACGGEGRSTGSTKTFVSKAYLTDAKHTDFSEAFAANTRRIGIGEQVQRCMEITGTASLVNPLPLDPDNVIIQQLNALTLGSNYYLYNLRTNDTTLLFRGGGRATPAMFNPRNGELLIRQQLEPLSGDEYEQRILIKNPQTGEFETHDLLTKKVSDRYALNIAGIDEVSGKYYVLTDLFSDQVEVWQYDPATRKFDDEVLVSHPEYSIYGLILGTQPSNFNQILGFEVAGPKLETIYVDPAMQAIDTAIRGAFPGQDVDITGYNDDLSKVLFETSSAQHPPAYHLLLDKKRVVTLGSQRPQIDPAQIGEQRFVKYPARDGLMIPAILDLPQGWKEGDAPLPTIIHPHGGPWARDTAGWDRSGWVPFLTSRGYAVLRPQYRGSAGFGRALWLAGDAQWGLKMQDDKDDGAAWLVKQGIADPNKLAIFGYSYGGFAAAAAVVRENSPYRCAISGAPVTDLTRLGRTWSDNRLQRILQGRTVTGMDPMKNAAKANIPVLLYVGDRDVRTPSLHARNFYNAVRRHVPAKFELIPDMPHSMPWYPRHQRVTLDLMERFLREDCAM